MRTIRDFVKLIESGAQPAVEFGKEIEAQESYADRGMRARALRMEWRDKDFVSITFSFTEFEAHNKPFEGTGYSDKKGGTSFTAREAGYYRPEDELYFNPDDDLANLLTPLSPGGTKLYQEYLAANPTEPRPSYVSWLEALVLASRAS